MEGCVIGILHIENEVAKDLDLGHVVDLFAEKSNLGIAVNNNS